MRYLYVFGTLIIALAVAWLAGFPGWVPFDPRRLGDLISALNPASAESAMHPHLPPALQTALSAAIVAAIAVIVVLVPARSIRRISAGNHNTVFEEERQSVWSWEGRAGTWACCLPVGVESSLGTRRISVSLRMVFVRHIDGSCGGKRSWADLVAPWIHHSSSSIA